MSAGGAGCGSTNTSMSPRSWWNVRVSGPARRPAPRRGLRPPPRRTPRTRACPERAAGHDRRSALPTGHGGAPICFTAVIVTIPARGGRRRRVRRPSWPVGCAPVDAAEQLHGVRHDPEDRLRFSRTPFGLPGRFDDQRACRRSRRPPATERRHRRLHEPGGAHQLGQARRLAFDDGLRGLGRDVARPEPGAAGRHHQRRGPRPARAARARSPAVRRARRSDRPRRTPAPRRIASAASPDSSVARAVRDTVRDRDHGGAARSLDHGPILPPPSDADVLPWPHRRRHRRTIEEDR